MALKGIANGGQVLALEPSFSPASASIDFKRIGFSKASTFPGYCKRHDREVFDEIESGYTGLSDRVAAIVTLRTLAREYFAKLAQIRLFNINHVRQSIIDRAGKEFYDEFMLGCALSKAELEALKKRLETMIYENKFDDLIICIFEFESPTPFAYAGSFSPYHDLKGNPILPGFRDEWGVVFAFCGRVGGENIFALTSLTEQSEAQVKSFFGDIESEAPNPRKLALNLGLEYIENLYFSPEWIESLSEPLKQQMREKMRAGLPGREDHNPMGYFELDLDF